MTEALAAISAADSAAAAQLPALLEEQAGLYTQLHALSSQQGKLVDGQADALLAVLAQRQGLIDRLLESNRKLEPYRVRWSAVLGALDPASRGRIGALVEKIGLVRQAIQRQDDEDCRRLSQASGDLARELARVSNSGQAARAYRGAQAHAAASRFADQRG
jgi:hypothetical protein